MSLRTIVDTGPLVAMFVKNDSFHAWAREAIAHLPGPMLTCESVLSEACFLLERASIGRHALFEFISRGVLKLDFALGDETEAVRQLMARYDNASLADACLVRMSELNANCRIMTLDSDFLVYRRHGRRIIPLIAPFG